jgi:hypothetical protein
MSAEGCCSMMQAIASQLSPLYNSIYKYHFQRGPQLANGPSFFVGENIQSPLQFDIISKVQAMQLYDMSVTLLLCQPQACGMMMTLIWRQQVCVLERVELEDDAADVVLGAVSHLLLSSCSQCHFFRQSPRVK